MRLARVLTAVVCVAAAAACNSSKPTRAEKPHVPAQPDNTSTKRLQPRLQSSEEPVKFAALQTFLPNDAFLAASGWAKSDVTGMALSDPIRGAQAQMTLKKSDSRIVVDIIDTVFNQALYAPVAAYLTVGFSAQDAGGYKRAITFQDQPAFEEWTVKDRTAGLTVLAGKRFLVHLQGTGFNSTDPLKAVAGQINIAKLAQLK